jgi:hypothetical protein
MKETVVKPLGGADKPARTFGWPRSPAVLFGIAAGFFVFMGIIFINTGILATELPVVQNGEVTHILSGYLWLLIALPFAVFAIAYAALEIAAGREFDESKTRIHFVCTLLAVLETIRVYMSWATTTGNVSPEIISSKSFGGTIAFLTLATGAFVWNLFTSKRKAQ